MKLTFNYKEIQILENSGSIIIANKQNGEWLKMTRPCFDYLKIAEREGYNKNAFLDTLSDNEDREYFTRILQYLEKYNMIENDTYNISNVSLAFSWAITNNCNLRCIHCCGDAGEQHDKDYTTKEMYALADKILECNPGIIAITGGEPLLRGDFFSIVSYIKNRFKGSMSIMTNGTLIDEKNAKFIMENFDSIDISLDGVDEETCSIIRGSGVFDKIIKNIDILKKYGDSPISLSMIVSKYTADRRQDFDKLNERLGTIPCTRKLSPTGRACDHFEKLFMGFEGIEIEPYDEQLTSSFSCGATAYRCGALSYSLFISGNGDLFPCGGLALEEFKIGNLEEIASLKNFLDNKVYIESEGYKNYLDILPFNSKTCKDCDVNVFCVQCPLYAYSFDKIGLFPEYCKDRKENMRNIYWRKK